MIRFRTVGRAVLGPAHPDASLQRRDRRRAEDGAPYALLTALLLVLLAVAPARADEARPEALRQVGLDQRLDEQVPLDLPFRDETGKDVVLGDYFGERPVLLNLVYYECPMLCTLVLNGTVSALRAIPLNIGEDFEVVTVSFDPRETPALAAKKKQTYLDEYRRPSAARGWHFLTGEPESIRRLAEAVGFRYDFDEKSQQFAHTAGIMVLTPQGRLSRYFYGVEYAPRDVRLGLVEASKNRIGSMVDQLLLFCFHYDPLTGRYSALTMNVVRAAGALTVLVLLAFIGIMLRRDRRRPGRGSGTGGGLTAPRPTLTQHPSISSRQSQAPSRRA